MRLVVVIVACASLLATHADPATAAYSSASGTATGMFNTATLSAPTSVAAGSISCGIRVTWTNPMDFTPTAWKIQRYTLGSNPSGPTQTVPGSQLSFDDTAGGLAIGLGYTWRVWATHGTNWVGPVTISPSRTVISLCL